MIKRHETRKILVGNVQIGGKDDVVIQSMCNHMNKLQMNLNIHYI